MRPSLDDIFKKNQGAGTESPPVVSPTPTPTPTPTPPPSEPTDTLTEPVAPSRPSLDSIFQKTTPQPAPQSDQPSIQPPEQKKGLLQWYADTSRKVNSWQQDIGTGILKGVGNTILGAGELGSKALESGYNATIGRLTGTKALEGAKMAEDVRNSDYIRPTNTAQKVGFYGEQVGEFLIPGIGEEDAGIALASKAPELMKYVEALPKGAQYAAKLFGRASLSSLDMAARTAIQSGGDPEAVKEAAVAGAATPALADAGKGAISLMGNLAKHYMSVASGVPAEAIQKMYKNPEAFSQAIKRVEETGTDMGSIVADVRDKQLPALQDMASEAYEKNLKRVQDETMMTKKGQLYVLKTDPLSPEKPIWVPTDLSVKGVKDQITKTLHSFGAEGSAAGIDTSKIALPKSFKRDLDEVVDTVYNWDDPTPLGLNQLRKKIDVYKRGFTDNMPSAAKQLNKILEDISGNLQNYVETRVPQVGEMNAKYSSEMGFLGGLKDELGRTTATPQHQVEKIANAFSDSSKNYQALVKRVGKEEAERIYSDSVAVLTAPWTSNSTIRKGLGLVTGTGGAILSLGAPQIGLPLVTEAAASSPRIVRKAAMTAGKAVKNRALGAVKSLAPGITRGAISQETQTK